MKYLAFEIHTGFVGGTYRTEEEAPDDWDEMTANQKWEYLNERENEILHEYISVTTKIVDENGNEVEHAY